MVIGPGSVHEALPGPDSPLRLAVMIKKLDGFRVSN
jgi:hypothetical protein